jgi:hypothetical protein
MAFWNRGKTTQARADGWGPEAPGTLTVLARADVETLLQESAACILKKDGRRLGTFLSDDLKATVTTLANGLVTEKSSLTRNSYLMVMTHTMASSAVFSNYEHRLKRVIEESPHKWVVECETNFTYKWNDQTTKVVARELVTIEPRNGYAKVTELISEYLA